MPLAAAVMNRAARNEPTHAVADQRELFEWNRPVRNQRLQQCCERASVRVDRPASVVAQEQQGLPALARDLRQPVLAGTTPVLLIEAQPVNRDHDPAGRARHHARGLRCIDRHAVTQHGHGQRQRVRREFQVIAVHAVECRHPRVAGCCGFTRGQQRSQGTESGVEPFAHHPRGAANAAVDQAGESARGFCARCAKRRMHELDRVVHLLDQRRDAERGIDGEAGGPTQVGQVGSIEGRGHGGLVSVGQCLDDRDRIVRMARTSIATAPAPGEWDGGRPLTTPGRLRQRRTYVNSAWMARPARVRELEVLASSPDAPTLPTRSYLFPRIVRLPRNSESGADRRGSLRRHRRRARPRRLA